MRCYHFCLFVVLFPAFCCAQIVHQTNPNDCCHMASNGTSGCKIITLTADKSDQYFETPLYPKPFPSGMTCTWAIKIQKNARIYATIEKFFLLVPGEEGCFTQTIMIRSPVEGLKMGPFCGKTGIPIINTPDNLLIIQLIDVGSKPGSQYQGFRVKFLESYETPNIELRPGNWFHNMGKPFTMNEAQIRYTLSQINPKKNDDLKIEVPYIPDEPPPTIPPPPRRTRPKRRRTTLKTPVVRWRPRNQPPPSQPPLLTYPPPKQESFFTLEVIIGIAVGGFVVLCLLIVALIKVCHRKKQKAKPKTTTHRNNNINTKPMDVGFNRPNTDNKRRYVPYEHENHCYKSNSLPTMHRSNQKKSDISLPSSNPHQQQGRLASSSSKAQHHRTTHNTRPHTTTTSTSKRSALKKQESSMTTQQQQRHHQHRAQGSSSKKHARSQSVSTVSRAQRKTGRSSERPVGKERSKSSNGRRGRKDEKCKARHFR